MSPSIQPQVRRITQPVNFLQLMSLYPERWPFYLGSQGRGAVASARWSLLLRHTGEVIIKRPGDESFSFFDQLNRWMSRANHAGAADLPFVGGAFVYLGYELAVEIESKLRLPPAESSLPVAYAAQCPVALIYDHWHNEFWLAGDDGDEFDRALTELAELDRGDESKMTMPPREWGEYSWIVDDPQVFQQGVDTIKRYIRAGDVFQVNLSREWRLSVDQAIEPLALYRALQTANPAPFSGIARLPGGVVVSSSPERLVSRNGASVATRPIAGTRPRGTRPSDDMALIQQLSQSAKEQAEHIMLIDLERNDLGRVCQSGSVLVDELMVIESYEYVHHIVSNVTGKLRPSASTIDLIKAVFPGGTITGCPKVRCMEIIAELEKKGRGCYTGAMGYISHHQTMDLNILIRTMLVEDGNLSFRAGAGIVADSDPVAELAETEFKARGLLRALGLGARDG